MRREPYSWQRWVKLLVGLTCFGVGIALMVESDLGLSPWEILHQGISRQTGIQIGTVSILMGVPIMLAWLPLGQKPGIGTLINIIQIGVVTDAMLSILPPVTNMILRFGLMVLGIVIIGIGSGLYLGAQMGAGPRDGLMLGLSRKTGRSVRLVRTMLELTVLVVGWLLGGTVGLGTLAFAFGIGPVVQTALHVFGRPSAPPQEPAPAAA